MKGVERGSLIRGTGRRYKLGGVNGSIEGAETVYCVPIESLHKGGDEGQWKGGLGGGGSQNAKGQGEGKVGKGKHTGRWVHGFLGSNPDISQN